MCGRRRTVAIALVLRRWRQDRNTNLSIYVSNVWLIAPPYDATQYTHICRPTRLCASLKRMRVYVCTRVGIHVGTRIGTRIGTHIGTRVNTRVGTGADVNTNVNVVGSDTGCLICVWDWAFHRAAMPELAGSGVPVVNVVEAVLVKGWQRRRPQISPTFQDMMRRLQTLASPGLTLQKPGDHVVHAEVRSWVYVRRKNCQCNSTFVNKSRAASIAYTHACAPETCRQDEETRQRKQHTRRRPARNVGSTARATDHLLRAITASISLLRKSCAIAPEVCRSCARDDIRALPREC